MDRKILVHVENRYVKGILLKSIANEGFGLLDIIDLDDLVIKLNAFENKLSFGVMEITDNNMAEIKSEITYIRSEHLSIPIIAIVSKSTSSVIKFAIENGINDILLLPAKKELFEQNINEKLAPYFTQINSFIKDEKQLIFFNNVLENSYVKEILEIEMKSAQRGQYPLAVIAIYLEKQIPKNLKDFTQSIKSLFRGTDKIFMINNKTFLALLPFVTKENISIVEQKLRKSFEQKLDNAAKIHLYSVLYPNDASDINDLFERLEYGINNSIAISEIKAPLKELTKTDIENYRKKIRQYQKFF